MGNKILLYNMVLEEVIELHLDKYHTIFLTNMVVRKLRHPEEKMDKIAQKTMKKMPELYGKKDIVETSARKCLDQLEIAIDAPESKVPEEWKTGQCVSHVVKKLAQIVTEKLD